MVWEMTVDMEHGQISALTSASPRPTRAFLTHRKNVTSTGSTAGPCLVRAALYFNCTQSFETALQNYVEYAYTRVSISYLLV